MAGRTITLPRKRSSPWSARPTRERPALSEPFPPRLLSASSEKLDGTRAPTWGGILGRGSARIPLKTGIDKEVGAPPRRPAREPPATRPSPTGTPCAAVRDLARG